jgi:hypothetical protein
VVAWWWLVRELFVALHWFWKRPGGAAGKPVAPVSPPSPLNAMGLRFFSIAVARGAHGVLAKRLFFWRRGPRSRSAPAAPPFRMHCLCWRPCWQ